MTERPAVACERRERALAVGHVDRQRATAMCNIEDERRGSHAFSAVTTFSIASFESPNSIFVTGL